MTALSRSRYAALFGPTAGDRIRLADTDLFVEITEDRSGGPAGPATRRCSAAVRCSANRWARPAPPAPTVHPTP